jgi:PAS domain S-box-containing protein
VETVRAVQTDGMPTAVEEELAALIARVAKAQELANMGDYDWHIPSDTNRWSDQLYRIYGFEPQSFNPSYEKFLSLLHPDDRDRVVETHKQAYATGEGWAIVERIVRPDGEVRYLSTNGEVVTDDNGTPVRMRGTCVDITERVRAEQEQEQHASRLFEAELRRTQAVEINDNVVQGLTAALYALELEDVPRAVTYLTHTLESARRMMSDLITPLDGELDAGALVRNEPASVDGRGES